MLGDRIARALARIEAAAGRIEAAAHASPGASGDPELAGKHEALRREASAALAEFDRLIETIEP